MHNPPMISGRRLVLLAAAAALIGCGSADDNRPAQWSVISSTIIQPACATVNCHSAVAQRAGFDLHDRATGHPSLPNRNFVLKGDMTGASALLHLLNGDGALRMPPDSPLPEADIALIDEWIRAGADNN